MRPRHLAAAVLAGFSVAFWVGLGSPAPAVAEPADRPLPRWDDATVPDPLRITAFGTSLTARAIWPDGLQAALAACLGRDVRVSRVAQPGMGSAWAETRIDAVAATRPDLVLVEFAINDADLLDGRSPADSRAAHLRLLAGLRAEIPGVRILLMTMNPVRGVPRRIQRPRLAAYDAMLREIAAGGTDTGLADFAPRWRAAWAAPGANPAADLPDGLHPDPQTAAALMVPVLAKMIGRAAGSGACPAG